MERRTFVSLPAAMVASPLLSAAGEPIQSLAAVPSPPAAPDSLAFESPSVVGNLPVFYERLKDDLTFPLAWRNAGTRSFRQWRRSARAKVEELLWQPADATPYNQRTLGEERGDGYLQRTIVFNVTKYSRVRAAMLIPDGTGPFPAVLLLHDHGAKFDIGKEKMIRPWYDPARLVEAEAWSARYFSGRFVGNELARRGYVVLAVDALGWGDRSGLDYESQQALASNFYNLGSSVSGLMAREDVRAAGLLATMPEVDRRRITAFGFSMGAYRAWQAAALSDHVSAAVAACWMTTLKAMMVPGNNTLRGQSAFYLLHPGLYRYLDIPDVASIGAPKPMYFLDGEQDPLFSTAGVIGAYDVMKAVWRSQRAQNRLRTEIWPGLGHVFVREMQDATYAWLDSWMARPGHAHD
jgi:dienelactone hydrolase